MFEQHNERQMREYKHFNNKKSDYYKKKSNKTVKILYLQKENKNWKNKLFVNDNSENE